MKGRAFTIFAGVSLLAGVVLGFQWTRSGLWARKLFTLDRNVRALTPAELSKSVSSIPEWEWSFGPIFARQDLYILWDDTPPPGTSLPSSMTNQYGWVKTGRGVPRVVLGSPYLYLVPPTFLLPAFWLFRFRASRVRRRRARLGQCITCGYDLRATPDRCPECGAIPAESNRSQPAAEV